MERHIRTLRDELQALATHKILCLHTSYLSSHMVKWVFCMHMSINWHRCYKCCSCYVSACARLRQEL